MGIDKTDLINFMRSTVMETCRTIPWLPVALKRIAGECTMADVRSAIHSAGVNRMKTAGKATALVSLLTHLGLAKSDGNKITPLIEELL